MNSEALRKLRSVERDTQERNRVRRLPDQAIVVNNQDIRRWNATARTSRFPQVLSQECLLRLDSKGSHTVQIVEDHGDTLTAQVFLKFKNQDQPEDAVLTIRTKDYNDFLPTALKLK